MERVQNPGTPSFYSRVLLVPAFTSAKWRMDVTLSNRSFQLNLYINKAFYDGKSQVSRSVDYGQGRSVSRDLTDAFACSDTSEIQKNPSVHLRTSGFSVHGLNVRNVPKPVKFSQLMSIITAKLRQCAVHGPP